MSKFHQLIWTLSVVSSVLFLYYFFPYFTVSVVLLALVIYLYIDYDSQQPQTRSHHFGNRPTDLLHAGLISKFRTLFREVVNNLSAKIYRPANINLNIPKMPSVNSYVAQSGAGARPLSGYFSHSNLNRDENVNSPRLRSISRGKPVQSPGFDGFHALSPILRRDSSNAAEDFNRLSISQLESPYQVHVGQSSRPNQSYIGNTSYNTRPLMDSSRDSSSNQKRLTPSSASRNVQTFAGPLLASTRYNLSSESALFADANSPGLSSRVAKYSQDASDRGRSITHQAKYSGPGQFPTVHLGKTSRLPVLSSRNTQKLARTPVRLRMAPPEPEERRLYALSDRSQALGDTATEAPAAARSVLDTLHDMSRKRLHAQLDDTTAEDDEGTKKLRRDRAATHKRTRETSPLDDGHANKRTRNNEILSSLSSSRHIGVKRKTTGDTSGSGVTMPADKVLKKSVPSPVVSPSTSMEQDSAPSPTPAPSPATPRLVAAVTQTTPIVVPTDTQVDDTMPMLKPGQETEAEWLRRAFMTPTSPVVLNMIHSRREEDAKNRLKTMMSAIGGKDMFGKQPAASTSVVPPSSTTATATTASPTPTTLNTKSPFTMKHVHFADNLTQVKTFDVPTPEPSAAPTTTVLSFPSSVTPATAPSFGLGSVVSASDVVTTSAGTSPSSSVDGAGFKLPTLGTGFTLPSLQGFGTAKTTSSGVATGFGGLGGAKGATSPSTGFSLAMPTAVTSAPTLAPAGASPLSSAFGVQPTSAVAVSSNAFTTTVPSVPTFGQLGAAATVPVMSSGFGKSVSSPATAFGVTPAASNAVSPPTFSQGMTFGSTSSPGLFGETTTTASPVSIATGPATTFGAGSVSSPAFGTPTTSAAPLPAYSSGFGDLAAGKTEPPKLFGFGATTQPSSMATPTKPAQSGFGSSTQFGAKAAGFSFNGVSAQTTTAAAPSIAPPSYGAATKTSAFQFGGSAGVTQSGGFSAAQTSKPTASVCGASPASVTPSTNGPSATPGTFSFGSTASKPFAFGDTSATPSLFGSATSVAAPVTTVQSSAGGFGSGVFPTQSGVNASNLTQVPIQPSASGLFNFGGAAKANGSTAAQPAQAASFSFGSTAAAKPGGFSFGAAPQASSGSGGFSFSAPSTQSAPMFGQTAQSTSTFGQTAQPTSTFGQTAQTMSAFGQTAQPASTFGQTAQPTTAFGQSAQPTSTFGQIAQPTSAFGQTAQPTSAFGQTAQPTSTFGQSVSGGQSTGGFQFGSAAAAPPGTGGFNFGQSAAGTAAPPAFGGGMASNVFQMGAPAALQAPGMFSIGTGSTGPRGRTGPRSRRR